MVLITIYKNIKSVTNPTYATVEAALESIRQGKLADKVAALRKETDKEKRQELKGQLPCILFSGKFDNRTDKGIVEHSGFCVLDIDHIGDIFKVERRKEEIKQYPFVYACFISPSGDGLKVVVRIPADIEKHRGHYRALMKLFPQVDSTSINLSRVCYASSDANIYINANATVFTDYQEEEKENIKLRVPLKMIKDSLDGEKHNTLLRAAQLVGGMVAGGAVEEEDGIKSLENAIEKRGVTGKDLALAKKTIRDGVEYGKNRPIEDEFVVSKAEADKYIDQIRDGSFQMGKTTGLVTLDEHWRFKDQQLVINNGHDNTGKTIIMLYLSMLSAVFHDWKWIIYSAENKAGGIKRKLVEFYKCKSIKLMTESELREAMKFVDEHYTLLKNNDLWTYKDLLDIGYNINDQKQHNAFLIDPYNSLYFPEHKDRHEWDYRATSEMRTMIQETGCSIYLNCHAFTDALRKRYPKESEYSGYPMPPDKSDTEGGGKFSNRADDFLTTHRLVYHPAEWMVTQIHVRKIKEMETGGLPTPMDSPVLLKSVLGCVGFTDAQGHNPLLRI